MSESTQVPITASVRHDVTRLDGRRLSADSVERIVVRRMSEAQVPALAMAVIDHGEVAYMAGFGYRDVERRPGKDRIIEQARVRSQRQQRLERGFVARSDARRKGNECRSRWSPYH